MWMIDNIDQDSGETVYRMYRDLRLYKPSGTKQHDLECEYQEYLEHAIRYQTQ